jgi:hypothetical protein
MLSEAMTNCPMRFHLTKSNGRSICALPLHAAAEAEDHDRLRAAFHFTSDPIDVSLAEKHVIFRCQGRCGLNPSASASASSSAAASPHMVTCVPWCVLSNFDNLGGSGESENQSNRSEDGEYFYPIQSINQEYRGTFWGGAVPVSDLLKSGPVGARRIRGGTSWKGVGRLLGVEASTVVIGCEDGGADALKGFLASNMSRSVWQVVACVSIRMCRLVPGRGGCTRWIQPPEYLSGGSNFAVLVERITYCGCISFACVFSWLFSLKEIVLAGNIDSFALQRLMTKADMCTCTTSLKPPATPRRILRRWLHWQLKKVAYDRRCHSYIHA